MNSSSSVSSPWPVSDQQLQALLELRPHVRVAHHVPGRLRVRFNTASTAIVKRTGDDAMACFRTVFPAVQDIQVNPIARSLLISYDAKRIPAAHLDDFFAAQDSAEAAAVLRSLMA